MVEALAWIHGFGGGCFVGLLVGIWLSYTTDTKRLDWLSRAGTVSVSLIADRPGDGLIEFWADVLRREVTGKTLRDCIDAGMKEQP